MKINAKQKFKNFGGADIKKEGDKPFMFGEAIANILLESQAGGKMKMYSLAERFYEAKGIVEVDEADMELIKGSVEATRLYNNLLNGQLLKYLTKIK